RLSGHWEMERGVFRQLRDSGRTEACPGLNIRTGAYIDVWVRPCQENCLGTFGVTLTDQNFKSIDVKCNPASNRFEIANETEPSPVRKARVAAPSCSAFVHLQVQVSGSVLRARLDGGNELHALLERPPISVALMTESAT